MKMAMRFLQADQSLHKQVHCQRRFCTLMKYISDRQVAKAVRRVKKFHFGFSGQVFSWAAPSQLQDFRLAAAIYSNKWERPHSDNVVLRFLANVLMTK